MNPTIVHQLHSGRTPCQMRGVPGSWPEGHQWSPHWAEVTCPLCLGSRVAPACICGPEWRNPTCDVHGNQQLRCVQTAPATPAPTCLVEGEICDFTGEGDDGRGPCVGVCWYATITAAGNLDTESKPLSEVLAAMRPPASTVPLHRLSSGNIIPPAVYSAPPRPSWSEVVTADIGNIAFVVGRLAHLLPRYLVYLTEVEAGQHPDDDRSVAIAIRPLAEALLPVAKVAARLLEFAVKRTKRLDGGLSGAGGPASGST